MHVDVADRHTAVAANIKIRYGLCSLGNTKIIVIIYNDHIKQYSLSPGTLLTVVTGCSRMLQRRSTSS